MVEVVVVFAVVVLVLVPVMVVLVVVVVGGGAGGYTGAGGNKLACDRKPCVHEYEYSGLGVSSKIRLSWLLGR